MFSRQAISVFLLLVAAIYSSEGIATPMVNRLDPPVNDTDCPLHLVIGPDDYYINATFECRAPDTTTLWRVDDYLLVDRDQFTRQGLSVLDRQQGFSKLVFDAPNEDRKGGFPFVFEALERCYFTLYCLAVENAVDVVKSGDINSSHTVASCHCRPQKPSTITIEGCDGDNPIVTVTRPPNFNGLVELNYTITINDEVVANVSSRSLNFTHTVGGCDDGCEICVKAISCEGESEEACVTATKDQCNNRKIVPDQPMINVKLKCEEEEDQCEVEPCSIEFELEYQSTGAKKYSFCDDNGCRDLTADDLKSVHVTVPAASLMDYTVTLMACTDEDVCFTTTTPLGTATCTSECPECPRCDDCCPEWPCWWCIIVAFVVGLLFGGTICGVVGYCIQISKDKRGKKTRLDINRDEKDTELMN